MTARQTNVIIKLPSKFAYFVEKQMKFLMTVKEKKPRNREPVVNYLTYHDLLRFGHDKIKHVKCSREWF